MGQGSLSQEEINALLSQITGLDTLSIEDFLNSMEQDALGEIGNISLGSSTTALSTLLNQRVEITAPSLSVIERDRLEETITENRVAVHVDYTTGIRGKNLLMIKEKDARVIASLMMGGDGRNLEEELTDIHLSAVQEAMNQMMGSAATSMSTMFNQKVDISPPEIDVLGFPPKKLEELQDDIIVQVSFRLKVGELIDSEMIQFIPLSFGKEMIHKILTIEEGDSMEGQTSGKLDTMNEKQPEAAVHRTEDKQSLKADTNVQKVEYNKFSEPGQPAQGTANIDLLYDIPLEITVELGRAQLPIKKILELGPGAIVELDKLAGEPVDILANHKLIAKGEVVVIEENFGVRITDIINPVDRLARMTR